MKDYEYLVHLLYCYIYSETPQEKPEEVSFENVYRLGRYHEVADIAFLSVDKLKNKPSAELYNEWKISYYFAAQRDARQMDDRQEIVDALHKKNIRTLEAQGTVTKKLYPEPFLRLMSDIDIVVDFDNLEKTKAVIESIGYTITQHQDYELFADRENSAELDVHTDFFVEYMYNRQERYHDAISSPFEHAYESENEALTYYLTDDYFYLYSIIHTIKHYETAGCGIRRILDLYYLKKAYKDKVDSEFIDRVIDENGFRKTYELLFALEAFWFENEPSTLDLSETIADVVTSGNHGNEDIFTRNNLRKDVEGGMRFAKIKRILSFVFPPKEYVYLGYPVCRERGYSTVTCWFYRIVATIKKFKFSHTIYHIKTIIKSK